MGTAHRVQSRSLVSGSTGVRVLDRKEVEAAGLVPSTLRYLTGVGTAVATFARQAKRVRELRLLPGPVMPRLTLQPETRAARGALARVTGGLAEQTQGPAQHSRAAHTGPPSRVWHARGGLRAMLPGEVLESGSAVTGAEQRGKLKLVLGIVSKINPNAQCSV